MSLCSESRFVGGSLCSCDSQVLSRPPVFCRVSLDSNYINASFLLWMGLSWAVRPPLVGATCTSLLSESISLCPCEGREVAEQALCPPVEWSRTSKQGACWGRGAAEWHNQPSSSVIGLWIPRGNNTWSKNRFAWRKSKLTSYRSDYHHESEHRCPFKSPRIFNVQWGKGKNDAKPGTRGKLTCSVSVGQKTS